MTCKFCGSEALWKYGTKGGNQYYRCKGCGRKFAGTGSPEGMHFSTATIGEGLSLFYDGLSLADISRHIQSTTGVPINPSSVWRWVITYSQGGAERLLDRTRVSTSKVWVIDETVVSVAGKNVWYWDIIDERTRFLIGTHLSASRTLRDATETVAIAQRRSKTTPRFILSDGLKSYPQAIESVFGADAVHVKMQGLTSEINTNLIERFHGTLKERTKVMRGLKTMATARVILNGFVLNYNFLRPHMTLKGKTPAHMAGVETPFRTWIELVDYLGKKAK